MSADNISMHIDEQASVAFLLHDTARRFRQRFDHRARDLGVTRQQWRALMNLARRPAQTQAELADTLEVERITLCRMIDRLTDAGLVERRGDPADRRVWRLHLTPRANAMVSELAIIGHELEEEALRGMSAAERVRLYDDLLRLRDALSTDGFEPRAATA